MSCLCKKKRPVREVAQFNPNGRFQMPCEYGPVVETIGFAPDDKLDGHFLRVLIVDDYRPTADSLVSLVKRWGHDLRCVYDGSTGVKLAAAFQPDVMLLDILMPNVSGVEVAAQIRRQDPSKHCFMIAITGRTDAKHRYQCYEAGIDLVLIKPIVPSHMQTLLTLETQRVRSRKTETQVVPVN